MRASGVELVAELDDLAVMGFVEVMPRLPFFVKLERRLRRLMDQERPDLVVLVDFPGFNMRMARAAHDRGLRVLYYVAPKVWAWRTGRARELGRIADRVATVLPFEAELLGGLGVDARYVGHPLLDRTDPVTGRADFFEHWGLDPARPLLALLPGSREQELARHIEPFTRVAEAVIRARPDVLPVFSRAASVGAVPFHDTGFPVVGDTRALLRYATAALVKSGTATLEAALEGTPHVIGYRTSPFTWAAARRLVEVDHVGLPNLVAGRRIVPEFLQDELVADDVAAALIDLLDEASPVRSAQLDDLERVREVLGGPGASARVAAMAAELLDAEGREAAEA